MSESPLVSPRTGLTLPQVTVTAPTTILVGFEAMVHIAGGAYAVSLAASPDTTSVTAVTDADGASATHNITISGNGHTIDGAATATIKVNGASLMFAFDDIANEWKSILYPRKVDNNVPVEYASDAANATGGGGGGGGGGPTIPVSWTVPAWWIDPVHGSDTNAGTSIGAPLKTWAKLVNLWGTTSPVLQQSTTITFLSDQPDSSDPVVCLATVIGPTGNVTIVGQLVPVPGAAGTFTSVTARDRATNQKWEVGDTSKAAGFWTPLVGLLVNDTTAGAWFWVDQDLGGTNAFASEPLQTAVGNATPAYQAIAPGDAYEVLAPTKVCVVNFNVVSGSGEASELRHLWITATNEESQIGYTVLTECRADTFIGTPAQSFIVANGYLFGFEATGLYLAGGVVTFEIAILPLGGQCVIDGDALLDAPVIGIQGTLVVGAVYFGSALEVPNLQYEGAATGSLYVSNDALYGVAALWGPSTVDTHVGGDTGYTGTATAAFLNLGGLTLDGAGTASSYDLGTGAWTPGIALTVANLDAATPAGFGGVAYGTHGDKVRQIA